MYPENIRDLLKLVDPERDLAVESIGQSGRRQSEDCGELSPRHPAPGHQGPDLFRHLLGEGQRRH